MRRRKQPRTTRNKGSAVVVTERDCNLLILAGLCGYVSLEQIARALFPSSDRARRRNRQLFDAGFIDIKLVDSRLPNLVTLTPEGRSIVRQRWPELGDRLKPTRPIRLAGVQHHLLLVDMRLYLSSVLQRYLPNSATMRWQGGTGDLARELGFGDWRLQPDAVVELRTDDDELSYLAVEVDCGTEPMSVLSDKLGKYADMLIATGTNVVTELWLMFVGGAQRGNGLARLVKRVDLADRVRLMSKEHVVDRPVRSVPPVVAQGAAELGRR